MGDSVSKYPNPVMSACCVVRKVREIPVVQVVDSRTVVVNTCVRHVAVVAKVCWNIQYLPTCQSIHRGGVSTDARCGVLAIVPPPAARRGAVGW